MARKILVSHGLPDAARDLIPGDIEVDYNGFDRALPKHELMSRLRGRHGLICQVVDIVDDDVLSSEGLRVVANITTTSTSPLPGAAGSWSPTRRTSSRRLPRTSRGLC